MGRSPADADFRNFWLTYLHGCESTPFPPMAAFAENSLPRQTVQYSFSTALQYESSCKALSCLASAWGLVAGSMTASQDVVFGVVHAGGCLTPVRLLLRDDQTIGQSKDSVQIPMSRTNSSDSSVIKHVAELSADCQTATTFQTVLVVQSEHDERWSESDHYGLVIRFNVAEDHTDAIATFNPSVLEQQLVFKLLRRLDFITQSLEQESLDKIVSKVQLLPPAELDILQEWNSVWPFVDERCIHDVIRDWTCQHPAAQAVCAWDGNFSYAELDNISNNVAADILEDGVDQKTTIPLIFEKSKWTVVAMLSVLKAGGTFILLDPALPQQRIEHVCQLVGARIGLVSTACKSRLPSATKRTLILDQTYATNLELGSKSRPTVCAQVDPRDAAYIIFTSGSTGLPKGCVIEHRSYCSAATGHGRILGFTSKTRALQFGSYNFAGAIMETLMTLMYGGCVCVPSEEDRTTALGPAINRLDANWAFLTATVLANLHPEDVPSLRTICAGGEAIRSSQIREWAPKVHLRQTYGSAETAAVVMSARLVDTSANTSVGRPTTAKCWLVEPSNVDRLVPVGAPGEIIFEGPVIGREYIGDSEKSMQTFIPCPAWRAAFGPCASSSRFYRTGDIGAYRSDGSLELLGRKDTQVKLRGSRIELGEVEHQARLASDDVKEVAVELTSISTRGTCLICFFVHRHCAQAQESHRSLSPESKSLIRSIRDHLQAALPHYMVPTIIMPVSALPQTISGKTDRRRLRQMGSDLSAETIVGLLSVTSDTAFSLSPLEVKIQSIWSKALGVDQDSIGLNTSFFQLGGDSTTALKVATQARHSGFNVIVADVFRNDTIAKLAELLRVSDKSVIETSPENALFDFQTPDGLVDEIGSHGDKLCRENVEAVFPLTSVQEVLVGANVANNHFADYFHIDLPPGLDINVLERDCKRVLQSHPILRSSWLHLQGRFWQVVIRTVSDLYRMLDITDSMDTACADFCARDSKELTSTAPTAAWILLRHETQGMRLVLRASHAQYDAFSAPLIFQAVFDSDRLDELVSPPKFDAFLSHVKRERPSALAFWKSVLKDSQPTQLVPHLLHQPITPDQPAEFVAASAQLELPSRSKHITVATLIRVSWAIVLSQITGTRDIVCGQVIAGRNAPIPHIEKIIGCCLNIVPARVNLSATSTVTDVLQASQEEFLQMGDADSLDYKDILAKCTDWPEGVHFDSILHHRAIDTEPEIRTPVGRTRMKEAATALAPPFIFIVSHVKGDSVEVDLFASNHLLTEGIAQKLITELARILEMISSSQDHSVATVMSDTKFCLSGS